MNQRLIDANALTYTRCSDNACDSAYDVKCQSCPNAIIRKHSIDNAPTITPDMAQVLAYECGKSSDRPKGKWIECDGFCECSECQHREDNDRFIWNDMNFCSTCGAEMVEVTKNE